VAVYEPQAPPVAAAPVRWSVIDRARIPPNVWFLGLTSLLTDVSSEMVASVLPLYLVVYVGLSPLAFGALDGLSHGMTAVARWAGGAMADGWRRHKEVAALGYGVSAICRLAVWGAGANLPALGAAVTVDRIGKGIRTSPRDALISLSAPADGLGTAFGVHRSLDAAGAMLGPLVAFAVLAAAQTRFDVVFVTAFSVAIVGLGVLICFVTNPASPGRGRDEVGPSLTAGFFLFRRADFLGVMAMVSAMAALTISDGFIYLALREQQALPPRLFPLLFVGTSAFYLMLALPAGRLADRFGRVPVFIAGHAILAATYLLLVSPAPSAVGTIVIIGSLGAYYAATDGVVAALASGCVPAGCRGTGIAFVATAQSLGRLGASVAFGWCWTQFGRETALTGFAIALMAGVLVAGSLARTGRR
jgi:hypothetical protein